MAVEDSYVIQSPGKSLGMELYGSFQPSVSLKEIAVKTHPGWHDQRRWNKNRIHVPRIATVCLHDKDALVLRRPRGMLVLG
jgi:hypothetical protein